MQINDHSALHGFILLDKPPGITSNQALYPIKRAVKPLKTGHAGTLDPLASGLLPVAIGEATKALRFITNADKAYEFTIRWGEQKDTDDADGAVIARSDVRPSQEAIRAALPSFIGKVEQVPPDYSAIKVGGKRAYALAREGKKAELQSRKVNIHTLDVLEVTLDEAHFRMQCGKGTYVRAIARDLSKQLGTVGHISALRRTAVGRFSVKAAFPLEKIKKSAIDGHLDACTLPMISALDDIPALRITTQLAARVRQGQSLTVQDPALLSVSIGDFLMAHKPWLKSGKPFMLCNGTSVVAACELDYPHIKTLRVFNI